ncbi:ArdC-like ssDNA-binding domain-containing protein [Cellulosimicrobium sp. Marseille-Q4280]|uniref:ArdC-like ssDNA-binding domain-containing protein n=1 Tax=Cellulosimicrobium sp. Marseille-Q4280 TaxID=2937992 RepID=UPI00203D953F|nr:ArdC-like ssDNA-binding domain-containing protein [Cellulosimicrobium sp. Marseille-Q4280]
MTTPTPTRSRVPAGVRTGGQFAVEARGEADVDLATAPPNEPAGEELAETVFTRRYDSVEDKVAAFHAELEQRVSELAHDENWLAYLDTMAKFHRYSMLNTLLIAAQRPGATKVAGFRKWKDELGRHVRKGEKGISIFAPKTRRVPVTDAAGNPVKGENGKAKYEVRCIGFTTTTVFDVSQTDGPEMPAVTHDLSGEPPAGFTQDLEAAITAQGYTIGSEDLPGTARGYTDPRGKRVVVEASLSPAMRAKVLAHELGHIACGHTERLEEYHSGHRGGRGQMEVEAESVAYALCRANGMSTQVGDVSGTYVAGWAGPAGSEAVKASANAVAKATRTVLESQPWRNVE